MGETFLILISAALVNNFVLVQFLGLCPFMGVSSRLESAVSMCLATTFVLTLSAAVSYPIHRYLLVPLELEYLRIIVFIVVIAGLVQLTELVVARTSPLAHRVLGIFLPLITTNCAVLGVALLNSGKAERFVDALSRGLGAALGFSLVLIVFAGMRERLATLDVPRPFQGPPIAMITAGIMSLAFMGFAGLG